ncbi:MAG: DUF1186 domain-containing protein [Candidatus Methanoperedens sp.]|nr:DUF1186 domain-containing protein [Candidatus Methanoperedens sp.]
MTTEKDEDLSDLIRSQIKIGWDEIKPTISGMPTEELVDLMVELKLYVNRTLALEIVKREDAVFYLRKLLQDGRHWRDDIWSPVHAIHIIALIKSKEAFELLLDIIRYRGDDLGDWLIEGSSGLLAAFGEDFIERLKRFNEDDTLEPFSRSRGVTALAVLARKYPDHKDGIKEHMLKLLNSTRDTEFATLIIDDIASLRDPSVTPDIHKAFKEHKIDEFHINEEDIESIIKGEYNNLERHEKDPLEHFSRNEIGYLHNLHYTKPDEKYIQPGEMPSKPKKKIGRNDPCPCGSGKKYKKCCMGKEKS